MKTNEIGINAGKIWQVIDQKGTMDFASIKKGTKLPDDKLYMAIGWLAREDKILFDEEGGKLVITLAH